MKKNINIYFGCIFQLCLIKQCLSIGLWLHAPKSNTAERGSCQNVNTVRKAGRHFIQWKSHFGYWRDSRHLSEPSAAVSGTRSTGNIMKSEKNKCTITHQAEIMSHFQDTWSKQWFNGSTAVPMFPVRCKLPQ